MSYAWYDLVGNVGVLFILGTYAGLQLGRMRGDGLAYPVLNGVGAACVLVSLAYDFNLSAFIIETAWVAISLVGITRWWLRRERPG